MRRLIKFLHTLGAIGMIGALATHIILLAVMPESVSLAEYSAWRQAIGAIAKWLLLPSLGLVLVSGLLAMAFGDRYYSAGWAWAKLALGLVTFEWTLLAVQGPAQGAAQASIRAAAGELDVAEVAAMVAGEWASLWVLLAIAILNVALGIWRPRFSRRQRTPARTQS
jgi:hypothetical protein